MLSEKKEPLPLVLHQVARFITTMIDEHKDPFPCDPYELLRQVRDHLMELCPDQHIDFPLPRAVVVHIRTKLDELQSLAELDGPAGEDARKELEEFVAAQQKERAKPRAGFWEAASHAEQVPQQGR